MASRRVAERGEMNPRQVTRLEEEDAMLLKVDVRDREERRSMQSGCGRRDYQGKRIAGKQE
jgi:hypothetical protein